MRRFCIVLSIMLCLNCFKTMAAITLNAFTNAGDPSVTLQWNMENYAGNSAYVLLKSVDGIVWQAAAANPIFRKYSASTILAFHDKFSNQEKLFYR